VARTIRRNPIAKSLRLLPHKVRASHKAYRRHPKHKGQEY
jgi:hypothetical protein